MARLTYTHAMTGVRPQRSEILNARSWAIVKLIGFIIAVIVVLGAFALGGAMLTGARINFHAPAVTTPAPPRPSIPAVAPAPALVPPALAPAAGHGPSRPSGPAPVPTTPAPASDNDEAQEQAYKRKLLEEGDP